MAYRVHGGKCGSNISVSLVCHNDRGEGSQVFFRGLGTALIRAFPLHAIIFLGYETTMALLHQPTLPVMPLEA